MSTSAFDVEHGVVKGLSNYLTAAGRRGLKLKRAAQVAAKAPKEPVKLDFKPVPKRTTAPTGPGSARSYMSGSAMASRDSAAYRAGEIGKSAFGVADIRKNEISEGMETAESVMHGHHMANHEAGQHAERFVADCGLCKKGNKGPGSMRARMNPRAWETQTAAKREDR